MERPVLIRRGELADLPALTAIYNHYVENTVFTFDLAPFSVEARRQWIEQFSDSGPHQLFVAISGGELLGYACSTRFRPKPAYDQSVEASVYVAPDAHGRQLGSRLYETLFAALQQAKVHRVYAGIALPNDGSRAVHIKFGFEPRYVLSEVGWKFDRYVDVEWFEKKMDG